MKVVDPLKHFGTFPTIAQADVCQGGTQTLTPRTWNIHGLKIFNDKYITRLTPGKHVPAIYIPLNPTLIYRKAGVYRGILIFLIFGSKHGVWVLVRTATARPF